MVQLDGKSQGVRIRIFITVYKLNKKDLTSKLDLLSDVMSILFDSYQLLVLDTGPRHGTCLWWPLGLAWRVKFSRTKYVVKNLKTSTWSIMDSFFPKRKPWDFWVINRSKRKTLLSGWVKHVKHVRTHGVYLHDFVQKRSGHGGPLGFDGHHGGKGSVDHRGSVHGVWLHLRSLGGRGGPSLFDPKTQLVSKQETTTKFYVWSFDPKQLVSILFLLLTQDSWWNQAFEPINWLNHKKNATQLGDCDLWGGHLVCLLPGSGLLSDCSASLGWQGAIHAPCHLHYRPVSAVSAEVFFVFLLELKIVRCLIFQEAEVQTCKKSAVHCLIILSHVLASASSSCQNLCRFSGISLWVRHCCASLTLCILVSQELSTPVLNLFTLCRFLVPETGTKLLVLCAEKTRLFRRKMAIWMQTHEMVWTVRSYSCHVRCFRRYKYHEYQGSITWFWTSDPGGKSGNGGLDVQFWISSNPSLWFDYWTQFCAPKGSTAVLKRLVSLMSFVPGWFA